MCNGMRTYIMTEILAGMLELSLELEELAQAAGPERRRQALQTGAEIIVADARNRAPVDTGLLQREGIAFSIEDETANIGWTKSGYYGQFLENGTSKMQARPHLRPAYEAKKNAVQQAMLQELKLD